MSYEMNDRKFTPDQVQKPCIVNNGHTPTVEGYMAAAGNGTQGRLCPFGAFVEEFPIEPEAEALAESEGMWMVAVARSDGQPLADRSGFFPGNFTWVPMDHVPEGAGMVVPNTAGLRNRGVLPPSGYACPVFGHDCPVYYGFDKSPYR